MASFLLQISLCCILVSVQLAASALHQYSENQQPVGYPYHGQNLQPLPPHYQYLNQYTQGAKLQAPNLLHSGGGNPPFAPPDNIDQLARGLCEALLGFQPPGSAAVTGPADDYNPSESTEASQDSGKRAAGAGSVSATSLPGPLQAFSSACTQLYAKQPGLLPRPVPAKGPAFRSVPTAPSLATPTTGADGPDAAELAQLQARFAGIQLQEAEAGESFTKNSQAGLASPAKLEQLEPDAELIPGAQQPAQTPPVPVNPGLLPGQRVYIVHPQPNLYGQNPLYNAVPGGYGPKSGVPLPGGYQKVYIVDPQSGYPTQGFPQSFYSNAGNNQQQGVPLQFGQRALGSRPGTILSQPGFFPGFGQPLEFAYDYQQGPGNPYLPRQFTGQLKQGQSNVDEASPANDVISSTEETEKHVDGHPADSAEKLRAVTRSTLGRKRRPEDKGSSIS